MGVRRLCRDDASDNCNGAGCHSGSPALCQALCVHPRSAVEERGLQELKQQAQDHQAAGGRARVGTHMCGALKPGMVPVWGASGHSRNHPGAPRPDLTLTGAEEGECCGSQHHLANLLLRSFQWLPASLQDRPGCLPPQHSGSSSRAGLSAPPARQAGPHLSAFARAITTLGHLHVPGSSSSFQSYQMQLLLSVPPWCLPELMLSLPPCWYPWLRQSHFMSCKNIILPKIILLMYLLVHHLSAPL